ncbi:MAG TPA: urease accessory protein [Vicinamibacteria bacterium]|nr:urease accessory protein [Vicinamibacteria bacterium]
MASLLTLGFFLGMRHALEADHVAAVASLATRTSSARDGVRLAAFWGTGHAVTLLVVGLAVAGLGAAVPHGMARVFEAVAGLLLAALGLDVLRRLRRRHVHFHLHEHGDGVRHLHAHSHTGQEGEAHDPRHHHHRHPPRLLARALVMGSLHGMAGSAALLVVSLQGVSSAAHAVAYMAVFGVGSVLGMMLFSLAIVLPLRLKAGHLERAGGAFEAALGVASVVIGLRIALLASLGH